MSSVKQLRELGLFDARVPRYTSYPPANHFSEAVGPEQAAQWMQVIPSGARVSLYLHIPYCRRLCWFCACRTQGTSTDRPLIPYLALLKAELALVSDFQKAGVKLRWSVPGCGRMYPSARSTLAAARPRCSTPR